MTEIDDEKKALSKYGSSDSGASLGDILGSVLKTKKNLRLISLENFKEQETPMSKNDKLTEK